MKEIINQINQEPPLNSNNTSPYLTTTLVLQVNTIQPSTSPLSYNDIPY